MMSKREKAPSSILSWCKLGQCLERLDDSVPNATHGAEWVRPTPTVPNAEANETFQIWAKWKWTQGDGKGPRHAGLWMCLAELEMILPIAVELCSFPLTWFPPRQHCRKGKPRGKPKNVPEISQIIFKKAFKISECNKVFVTVEGIDVSQDKG